MLSPTEMNELVADVRALRSAGAKHHEIDRYVMGKGFYQKLVAPGVNWRKSISGAAGDGEIADIRTQYGLD